MSPSRRKTEAAGVSNPLSQRIKVLVDRYSEKKGKSVKIKHPQIHELPEESRQLIKLALSQIYRKDFEILRKAFDEKLELYLRAIADVLAEAAQLADLSQADH